MKKVYLEDEFCINQYETPRSLDEFDINIFDLTPSKTWEKNYGIKDNINSSQAFSHLKLSLSLAKRTKNIIVIPQDGQFHWNSNRVNDQSFSPLRDILEKVVSPVICELTYMNLYLCYEPTKTKIGMDFVDASFYFNNTYNELTKSYKSEKLTTILLNDICFTTLNILGSRDTLFAFMLQIGLIKDFTVEPEWVKELYMFDDLKLSEVITIEEEKVNQAQTVIETCNVALSKNSFLKSCLFTNSSQLVDVVFEILSDLLKFDLSMFIDQKKEDFIIPCKNKKFIGEIKGVTSNVRSEHISQLDVHYQSYISDLEPSEKENVKAILIINHQRNKVLHEREPVHQNQIDLAVRNGCLIIETITLLKMYEQYLVGSISEDEISEILLKKTGLLVDDDFQMS